jgi:RNA polymerase sigma-70 factor (ECF subfamily)
LGRFSGDSIDPAAMSKAVSQPRPDDDARDLAAAIGGDHTAFARLYDRHSAVVLSLCRRSTGGLGEAEDATQETFIRAFGMLDRLNGSLTSGDAARGSGGGVRSWLYAIARRVCSERRRASFRRSKHEGLAMRNAAISLNHLPGGHDSPDAIGHDQLDRLTAALDRLDDRERLAIHLHYLDSDPLRAAESALGLSRSGYYKLLARAREKLAALMREVQTS